MEYDADGTACCVSVNLVWYTSWLLSVLSRVWYGTDVGIAADAADNAATGCRWNCCCGCGFGWNCCCGCGGEAELIVFVLIQVLMMSVWAQVHGQVLMCMPVCAIGTDDSGDKFMKNIFVGRSAA